MARNLFRVELSGAEQIDKELRLLAEKFPEITMEAMKAQEDIVVAAIKQNWISLAGGQVGDYVYDSVGKSYEYGANQADTVGTVGVYKIDSVMTSHGKTEKTITRGPYKGMIRKPMNAPQIAYWIEFGTSRLTSGTRKKTGQEYDPEELITNAGKPFISNAFYGTLEAQQQAFIKKFNEMVDKVTK